MLSRFRVDRGAEAGLTIDDLDVDRYDLDGRRAAGADRRPRARPRRQPEPELAGSPPHQHPRLRARHGAGRSRAGERQPRLPAGRADPSRAVLQPEPQRLRHRRHVGEPSGPVPAGTTQDYVGTAGVQMSSFVRRAAFALAFLDYNVLGSGAIDDDSQMLWVRNVRDRLTKLAPFLSYDGDPYPVVVDGRVLWVVDAYTTTSRYPYAQRIGNEVQLTRDSGLPRDANYVRNSVKAVVDAYDGSVRFYVNDPTDPIIQAWQGAFGDLFTPGERDARRRCASTCATPRTCSGCRPTSTPSTSSSRSDFFEREGAWSVAQAPSIDPRETDHATTPGRPRRPTSRPPTELASESSTSRFIPYYTMFADPSGGGLDRVRAAAAVRAVLARRRAHRAAGLHDGVERSRHLRPAHRLRRRRSARRGPRAVSNSIDSEPTITQQIALQTGGGNRVRFGDLQLVPVADGLLWVRPFYAAVPQGSDQRHDGHLVPLRDRVRRRRGRPPASRSGEALGKLFPGFEADLGDRVGADGTTTRGWRGRPAGRRASPTGDDPGRAARRGRPAARRGRRRPRRPRPRRVPGQGRRGQGARRPGARAAGAPGGG